MIVPLFHVLCFFINHPARTEIYTLSLHDALPIYSKPGPVSDSPPQSSNQERPRWGNASVEIRPSTIERPPASQVSADSIDRKSTRLNSSHRCISYAVFCLKKKKHEYQTDLNILI